MFDDIIKTVHSGITGNSGKEGVSGTSGCTCGSKLGEPCKGKHNITGSSSGSGSSSGPSVSSHGGMLGIDIPLDSIEWVPIKATKKSFKITNCSSETSPSIVSTSQRGTGSYLSKKDKILLSVVDMLNEYEMAGLILYAPFTLMEFEKEIIKDFEVTDVEMEWAFSFLEDIGYKISWYRGEYV